MGPSGQPSARVAKFNNASLSDAYYNKQGRRYDITQQLDLENAFTLTASIYVPAAWVDAAPGKPGCEADIDGCARVSMIEVELGESTGGRNGTFRPTFIARMGLDNRVASAVNSSYATISVGGPLTEGGDTSGLTWPISAKNTKLDFPVTSWPLTGWEGFLRKDDWNHFSFEAVVSDGDNAGFNINNTVVARNCNQTLQLHW